MTTESPLIVDKQDDSDESAPHTPESAAEGKFSSRVTCRGYGGGFGGRGTLPVLVLVSVLTVVTVCSLMPSTTQNVLTVAVPSKTLIRRVRMYSDKPSLSNLRVNSSDFSLVSRLQLLDLTGCLDTMETCKTYAQCESEQGEITCRCQRGYYVSSMECHSCSTSCPVDHFMVSPCSSSMDTVCQKCTVCEGSSYEVAPCTATQDTICLEASFPVGILPMNYTQLQDDGTEINVSTSSNVFMERLRDMEELETPMYVTNNQQSMEYVWKRTSGLQIKIGISDVYLVPEYVDLDHHDDSPFFHMNRNISSTLKETFQLTEKKYCRDPIPDYYSLYLHIFRNRISAAKDITCKTKGKTRNCPKGYKDGQTHLRRYINAPCQMYEINRRQNMTMLEDTQNSVVCTDTTPLSLIFGMPNPAADPMRFPSEECKYNQEQCQQCLQQDTCQEGGHNETVCCNINCYKLPTCSEAYSSACPSAGVECASGEVYMFTLSPVFEKMDQQFMCHVKYKMPKILYKINYEVRIPALNYHIEQRNFTITVNSLEDHRQLQTKLDFLNVQHNTWFDFDDEMIAITKHTDIHDNKGNLSLHPIKHDKDFTSGPYNVQKDFGTHMYTHLQFDTPFRYSSFTWMNDGCEKNLSWIYPNQTMYKPDSVPVIVKLFHQRGQIHYQVYRRQREPLIRLFVNSTQSVLETFQSVLKDSILIPSSLKTNLNWSPWQKIWTMNITGSLVGVPGVLGIQIFDKMMTRCIGFFDVIVTSSPYFNVQFNVSSAQASLPDIFLVLINDSSTCHQVLLSSVIIPKDISRSSTSSTSMLRMPSKKSSSIWLPVIIITVFSFIIIAVVFVIYVSVHVKARYSVEEMEKSESVLLNNVNAMKAQEDVYKSTSSKPTSRMIVLAFCILYVSYSIIFTFSVAFGVLYITHLSVFSNFTNVTNITHKLNNEMQISIDKLKQFENTEIASLKKQFKQRKDACSFHLSQDNSNALNQQVAALENQLQVIYVQNGSLQFLADSMSRSNAAKHIEKIKNFIQECNRTVHKHFKHLSDRYYTELEEVSKNGWLDFPREMFMKQKKEGFDTLSSTHLVKFMSWLQLDKADALLTVASAINKGLDTLAPSIEALVATNINSIEASSVPHIEVTNSTLQAYEYVVMQKHLKKDTEFYTHKQVDNYTHTVPFLDLKLHSMLHWFFGIFVVMDIILLCYRLAWLYTQVQEVREGCEDLIPQDETARKVLRTKTGQNPARQFDAYDPSFPMNENVNENENGHNYFLQAYPKSKEDILRDIWAQKAVKAKSSKEKIQDVWIVQDMMSCMCWLHRVLMSKLLWRVMCCAVCIVFLCCALSVLDSWLCSENFSSLAGVDLLVTELDWQTRMVNEHVMSVTDAMNSQLQSLKLVVDKDVEDTNTLLWTTWHTQMEILRSALELLCNSSGTGDCDLSFLHPYHHPPLSSCNFLPLQLHLYTDLNMVNVETLVSQELSPLVEAYRHFVFLAVYLVIVLLCANAVCQVSARTLKDYLIVSGYFPRARIYQFSYTVPGMSDDPNEAEKEIHRSASWLESCESGVYVCDNDDSARESTI